MEEMFPLNIFIYTGLVSIIFTSIAWFLFTRLREARYDHKNKVAELESLRQSMEKQIYTLNERLLTNEKRWKDVNHLLIDSNKNNTSFTSSTYNDIIPNDFLISNGIRKENLAIDESLVFVLTPFHEKFHNDFLVIKKTCEEAGFICKRGDEDYFSSDIFAHVLKMIVKANIIIANINGRNPNVLYELGIAQALNKRVILIAENPKNLPIDIQSKKFIFYNTHAELRSNLLGELQKVVSL